MSMQRRIDEAAKNWHRTKDPKYKDLWYKLVKEYGTFLSNIRGSNVSFDKHGDTDNNYRLF